MNGWILLHKKVWDSVAGSSPSALAVWVWLLTHCDENGVVRCGRNQIAKDTKVKAETVRYWTTRFLRENYQLTTIKTTNKYTEYRICNWDLYQRKTTNGTTRTLPKNYQQTTTNKEIKNKEKEIGTNVPLSAGADIKVLFSELIGLLGYTDTVKYTEGRRRKLQARVRNSSPDELRRAAQAIAGDTYMQGDNPAGKRYGDIDYLIRSDEQVDKWIQKAKQDVTYQADW